MPTRHKGIGMNRAKKRKVSFAELSPIFVQDTPEPEEPCSAAAPAPSPSPSPPTPEEPQQATFRASEIDVLYRLKQMAEADFIKVRKRWIHTGHTYIQHFNPVGKYRSEIVRAHERLLEADRAHDAAWLRVVRARREWRLLKTFQTVSQRAKRHPKNLALQNVALIAEARWLRWQLRPYDPLAEAKSFWSRASYSDVVANECGMAKLFGLVYEGHCRGLQGHEPFSPNVS